MRPDRHHVMQHTSAPPAFGAAWSGARHRNERRGQVKDVARAWSIRGAPLLAAKTSQRCRSGCFARRASIWRYKGRHPAQLHPEGTRNSFHLQHLAFFGCAAVGCCGSADNAWAAREPKPQGPDVVVAAHAQIRAVVGFVLWLRTLWPAVLALSTR